MPSFRLRSARKELIDETHIPFADIRRNMQELDIINSRLGGHRITVRGCRELLKGIPEDQTIHIVEIGCGGGDNLRVLKNWCGDRVNFRLTGIDINPDCIRYARSVPENEGIEFTCIDYRTVQFDSTPEIVFSSLFCHHFSNEELIGMMDWIKQNSRLGCFINDLHRHPLAYYSILIITKLFSRSYLVQNDAPLSVLRGFRKREWESILSGAGIRKALIRWQWAFRWLIICKWN